jgi:Flp pilus assembly protein TadG
MLFVLVGFLALAVDGAYVWVAQNELQNAADAGALAGARFLINPNGTINTNANQIAYDAATSNDSTNIPVEVNWSGGNSGDVQRGHWSRATLTFTPNANTTQTNLWQGNLDADVNFINAVRVTTRRQTQPVNLFIAGILGHNSMQVVTDAVAYIEHPGNTLVSDFDMPIVICIQSMTDAFGAPNCDVGRMINSGDNLATYQTGGWTNFNQPCGGGGTNASEVSGYVDLGCADALPDDPFSVNMDVDTQGGQIQSAFTKLYNCWKNTTNRSDVWTLTLPVILCNNHRNITTCETVYGAVTVTVVWITGPGEDPTYSDAPKMMGSWNKSAEPDGYLRWQSFVSESEGFNLENLDGSPASYAKKTIYFTPECDVQPPIGTTGGGNAGMMAARPVLVE